MNVIKYLKISEELTKGKINTFNNFTEDERKAYYNWLKKYPEFVLAMLKENKDLFIQFKNANICKSFTAKHWAELINNFYKKMCAGSVKEALRYLTGDEIELLVMEESAQIFLHFLSPYSYKLSDKNIINILKKSSLYGQFFGLCINELNYENIIDVLSEHPSHIEYLKKHKLDLLTKDDILKLSDKAGIFRGLFLETVRKKQQQDNNEEITMDNSHLIKITCELTINEDDLFYCLTDDMRQKYYDWLKKDPTIACYLLIKRPNLFKHFKDAGICDDFTPTMWAKIFNENMMNAYSSFLDNLFDSFTSEESIAFIHAYADRKN